MRYRIHSSPGILYAVGVLRSFEPPKSAILLRLDPKKRAARSGLIVGAT